MHESMSAWGRRLRSTRPLNEPTTFPGFGLLFFLGFRLRFRWVFAFLFRRIVFIPAPPSEITYPA